MNIGRNLALIQNFPSPQKLFGEARLGFSEQKGPGSYEKFL